MAEFIMKEMVRKAGLALRIDSAAVSYEEEGNDIYPPAKRTLLADGVPFQRHRAHRVSDAEASEYDIIVVMDSSNRRLLSHIISPENMTKVHMMMEYAGSPLMFPILGTPATLKEPTVTSPRAARGC